MDPEQVIYRAVSVSNAIITGMKVVGITVPNPYSDMPIYEVYVPKDKIVLFASITGLRNDIVVYSSPKSLFNAPLSKTIVLAYSLNNKVDHVDVKTFYGYSVKEASIKQALVDVIRNDYWYYTGIAFEVYYARKYIDPTKVLEIADRLGMRRQLYTIDYIVSETLR